MKRSGVILLVVSGVLLLMRCAFIEPEKKEILYSSDWESLRSHPTPEWFKDGKFGIYFHWGVYSVPAYKTEWYARLMYLNLEKGWGRDVRPYHVDTYGKNFQYHEFIPDFTAEHFNAKEWAALFKAAGARWAGPVAEHHDHFSMWNSKINPWNAAKMGPKRDIVGELEKAIKAEGLKFTTTLHLHLGWGFFPEWTGLVDTGTIALKQFYGDFVSPLKFDSCSSNPEKYGPPRKVVDLWNKKIFEVIDGYKPDMLWFDGRLNIMPEADRQQFVAHYYNEAAKENRPVVLNYKGHDLPEGVGVLDLERSRLSDITEYPWLTDDSWTWKGWAYSPDHEYKTANNILDDLIDIVSKNGCLLLNITPKADGTIPQEIREGLLEMGHWLEENGEAIYGTRPFLTFGEGGAAKIKDQYEDVNDKGVHFGPSDIRFTTKGKYLYLLQMGIPQPGQKIMLKSFARDSVAGNTEFKSIKLVGSKEKIEWTKTSEGLELVAPNIIPNDIALVYKASIK